MRWNLFPATLFPWQCWWGGKEGGLCCSPPSQSRAFEQFIKLLKSIQAGGRFNKSLPLSPSDERGGEGDVLRKSGVGGGMGRRWVTKMWKNNQRHTPIGRHQGKVAFFFFFLKHLPLIFIPEQHNWFLMRCLLSEVPLILPDSHFWALHCRQTKRHTNLRLPGVS